jgi:AraC-like DNA-binding protein
MVIEFITLISGFNFLVFSLVLLLKSSPIKRANLILGGTFLLMTVYSIILYLLYSFYNNHSYNFLSYYVPIDIPLLMLMGPAIYFYLREVLNKAIAFRSAKTWLHGIPVIPSLVFIVYLSFESPETRLNFVLSNFEHTLWQSDVLNALFFVQLITYLMICFFEIKKHLKISHKSIINNVQIEVKWLKTYFLINLLIMLVTAPIIFYFNNDKINTIIGLVAMDIQFIYIFLKSAWQTAVFPTITLPQTDKIQEPSLKIADKQAEIYFKILVDFMNTQKPYLDGECSIQDVSERTSIPLHHLSNIINQRLEKNFADFINEYRVEAAKEMLISKKYETLTMEAIGFECGFGSKSIFNKSFKKYTEQTPTEFRKSKKNI